MAGIFAMLGAFLAFLTEYLIESHKSRRERKNHISKTRFDKEFEIYQELSEKNLTMIYDAGEAVYNTRVKESYERGTLIVVGNDQNDILDDINEHIDTFVLHYNQAEFLNKRYAPFINKRIFDAYNQLVRYSEKILTLYRYYIRYENNTNFTYQQKSYDKESAKVEIEQVQKELSKLSEQTLDDVRNYLRKLDVKEY